LVWVVIIFVVDILNRSVFIWMP